MIRVLVPMEAFSHLTLSAAYFALQFARRHPAKVFFLILAVIAFLEPSIWNIMIIIGFTGWMGVTRLVRADFISLRERDFVKAAKTIGASDLRIIFMHILPNAMASILVAATLGIAGAILTEPGNEATPKSKIPAPP